MGTWIIEWGLILLTAWVGAPRAATPHPLTFDDRARAQEAIERVYYEHRIWPQENPGPKPPFEQMISKAQIEAKVEDYLKKSVALDKFWQRPIQPEQLQAEMDRMAKQTQDPETLKELFAALDNDPHMIAECLARPVLADRLIRNWYAYDTRFHKEAREKAEKALKELTPEHFAKYPEGLCSRAKYVLSSTMKRSELPYMPESLKAISTVPLDEVEYERIRARLPRPGEPLQIREEKEVFIIEMLLLDKAVCMEAEARTFQKRNFDNWWHDIRHDLEYCEIEKTQDRISYQFYCLEVLPNDIDEVGWVQSSLGDVPIERLFHKAVWTGSEMIIWGGIYETWAYPSTFLNSGGRYNPATDSWIPVSLDNNCPGARAGHVAVWTGREMIIWGGSTLGGEFEELLNTGGRYDPSTDTWRPTSTGMSCPSARRDSTVVWTGAEMIIWGGLLDFYISSSTDTGARYDPILDTWSCTTTYDHCPSARFLHTAIWTGNRMIVWGGIDQLGYSNTGAQYNPITDRWSATSLGIYNPSARSSHAAIWTGEKMLIWGGRNPDGFLNTGGQYDPKANSWVSTSIGRRCPSARTAPAVWTGSEMIVWGGTDGLYSYFNTGGRYDPLKDTWRITSVEANVPSVREGHSLIWTGKEAIVWGGINYRFFGLNSGARYSPSTDSWLPTSLGTNAPSERAYHTAVWTGAEMIVWGGSTRFYSQPYLNTGGFYNSALDTWAATTQGADCPEGRINHTAIWTGKEMIVWGGRAGILNNVNSGARFDPIANSWEATSTGINFPSAREEHTAIWTGTEMIVWGGLGSPFLNDGGRYDPSLDAWAATSMDVNCPPRRWRHTAVWTGSEMIIWGGEDFSNAGTGGRYNPITDTWSSTSTGPNCPESRLDPVAIWTGTEMIIYGGVTEELVLINFVYFYNSGGRYKPSTDSWLPMSPGPEGEIGLWHEPAIWTGKELIIWGGAYMPSDEPWTGFFYFHILDSGGRYEPDANRWLETSRGPYSPSQRYGHTAVWTGKEMIVWGGIGGLTSGGIYRQGSAHERPLGKP